MLFQSVIQLILATDMSRHNELMETFKNYVTSGFDFSSENHMTSVKIAQVDLGFNILSDVYLFALTNRQLNVE